MITVNTEQLKTMLSYWGRVGDSPIFLQGLENGDVELYLLLLDVAAGTVFARIPEPVGTCDNVEAAASYYDSACAFMSTITGEAFSLPAENSPFICREGDLRQIDPGRLTEKLIYNMYGDVDSGTAAFAIATCVESPSSVVYICKPSEPGSMELLRTLGKMLFGDNSPFKNTTEVLYMDQKHVDKLKALADAGCPADELHVKKLLLEAGDDTPVPFEVSVDPIATAPVNTEPRLPDAAVADVTAPPPEVPVVLPEPPELPEAAPAVPVMLPDPPAPAAAPEPDVPAGPAAGEPVELSIPADYTGPDIVEDIPMPTLGAAVEAAPGKEHPSGEGPVQLTGPMPSDALETFRDTLNEAVSVFSSTIMSGVEALVRSSVEIGRTEGRNVETQKLISVIIKSLSELSAGGA